MRNFDFRAWSRRRSTRALATAALILGPIAAVPAIMATGATAAGTGSTVSPATASTTATTSPTDTATSSASASSSATASASPSATSTTAAALGAAAATKSADPKVACGIGSGAFSYSLDGPKGTATVTVTDPACAGIEFSLVAYSLKSPGVSFPQTRTAIQTATVSSADKTVTLTVTVPQCYAQVDLILGHDAPATLTTWYFSPNNTLLDAADFTYGSCVITTTTPPPHTTTPPPSTTTPPPSTSTPPPSCPPGSTTPPPGSTVPPGTCEPPCEASPAPASCFSTPVLGFSTSQPPVYYSGGPSLPYTGANVPLRAGLLSALGLLCGGAALILIAGRTAPAAGHRRR